MWAQLLHIVGGADQFVRLAGGLGAACAGSEGEGSGAVAAAAGAAAAAGLPLFFPVAAGAFGRPCFRLKYVYIVVRPSLPAATGDGFLQPARGMADPSWSGRLCAGSNE